MASHAFAESTRVRSRKLQLKNTLFFLSQKKQIFASFYVLFSLFKKPPMSKQATGSISIERPKFSIPLSKNSYIAVTWARAKDTADNATVVAEFSGVLVIDGVKIAALNSLKILSLMDRETNKPVIHIGSMYNAFQEGDPRKPHTRKIYAMTFFPNAAKDDLARQNQQQFAENVVRVVKEFIVDQTEKMQKEAENPPTPRPINQEFAQLRGAQIRAFKG